MIKVRFLTLVGKFSFAETKSFPDMAEASKAVTAYAIANGFTKVRTVEDEDSLRFTATTPNGRAGRNVAFAEDDTDYSEFGC